MNSCKINKKNRVKLTNYNKSKYRKNKEVRQEFRVGYNKFKNSINKSNYVSDCFVEGCKEDVIKAHAIAKSKTLKLLEGNSKESGNTIITCKGDMTLVGNTFMELTSFSKKGKKGVSVFKGFCSKHDSIFDIIDKEDLDVNNNKHIYLYTLLASAYSLHRSMEDYNSALYLNILQKNKLDEIESKVEEIHKRCKLSNYDGIDGLNIKHSGDYKKLIGGLDFEDYGLGGRRVTIKKYDTKLVKSWFKEYERYIGLACNTTIVINLKDVMIDLGLHYGGEEINDKILYLNSVPQKERHIILISWIGGRHDDVVMDALNYLDEIGELELILSHSMMSDNKRLFFDFDIFNSLPKNVINRVETYINDIHDVESIVREIEYGLKLDTGRYIRKRVRDYMERGGNIRNLEMYNSDVYKNIPNLYCLFLGNK